MQDSVNTRNARVPIAKTACSDRRVRRGGVRWYAEHRERGDARALEASGTCARLERGVTLVEVLIVVAIIAMVASGVAVFALPRYKEAQVKSAETGARVIRGAIQNWQRVNNESSCPTVSQLVQEKQLDSASNTSDPWGEAYQLSCTDDDVIVAS